MEQLEISVELENTWSNYRTLQNLTVASCPITSEFKHDKVYEKCVVDAYPRNRYLTNWEHYGALQGFQERCREGMATVHIRGRVRLLEVWAYD